MTLTLGDVLDTIFYKYLVDFVSTDIKSVRIVFMRSVSNIKTEMVQFSFVPISLVQLFQTEDTVIEVLQKE